MVGPVSRLVLRCTIWALDRFYHVGRVGPPIPRGPILVIANHPNSLMDALVILKVAGRRVRPLAKAPLFDQALIGHVLRGLQALPVYRQQDYPGETERNEDTFRAAIEALGLGEAVLIFPEGVSHSEPRLAPLKTGAARIALRAEQAADWKLGLKVVPVGLTYHRKHAFRGGVAAAVGNSLEVAGWREMAEREEWVAVQSLTEALTQALEEVTLNLSTGEDRALIEAADALYAAEKRLTRPREREQLAPRFPRLQRFAEAVAWLRATDIERYRRLAASVRSYRHRLALLGVGAGELPKRFPPLAVARYAAIHGLVLLMGLPLAIIGTVAWYLPYQSPRISLNWYQPAYEAVATVKLATALLAFPITYLLWLTVGWLMAGWPGVVVLAAALPIAGLAALHWRDRWAIVREDTRLFWRALPRKTLREQLVHRRKALVAEFDRLAEQWQEERRRRDKVASL